jgi:hypothetical protein
MVLSDHPDGQMVPSGWSKPTIPMVGFDHPTDKNHGFMTVSSSVQDGRFGPSRWWFGTILMVVWDHPTIGMVVWDHPDGGLGPSDHRDGEGWGVQY